MTVLGWGTMVFICGLVWGGFGWFLGRAILAERGKSPEADETPH